jgi:hypothetical protein
MTFTQEQLDRIIAGDLTELNKMCEAVVLQSVESTLRSIPSMLGRLIEITTVTKDLLADLFKENPEFAEYKSIVAGVVQETDSQYPGMDYQQILKLAVPAIKERIALYKRTSGV